MNELERRIAIMSGESQGDDCLGPSTTMIRITLVWFAVGVAAWVVMAIAAAP